MLKTTVNSLLLLTIILGFVSIYITKKKSKTLISAATAYWFGWTFLLFGASVAVNNEWIMSIGELPLYYIQQLHFGAFVGFLIGTLITPRNNAVQQYEKLIEKSIFITNKISNKALIILFIFGLIFLSQRIQRVGLNFDYFTDVRQVYAERNRPFVEWAGTHLSVMISFLIVLLGIKDSKQSVNIKELLKYIIAAAPLGLANGSRIFLLNYLIIYLASLLICRGTFKFKKSIIEREELKRITLFLMSLLIIFSIIGFIRGGYGDTFNFFYTILIWPVSTISAMESWITMALTSPCTHGYFTFGWVIDFFDRIGVIDYSNERESITSALNYFNDHYDSAASIPKSILPELIYDFGKNGVFWSILIISVLLQVASLRLVGKGIFSHTLAVLCLISSFMTIQLSVIGASFVATLFWSFTIPLLMMIKKTPFNGQHNDDSF